MTCPRDVNGVEALVEPQSDRNISRRTLLKAGALAGVGAMASVSGLAVMPVRESWAAPSELPDIQFDLGNFIPPAMGFNDGAGPILLRFTTVFTGHTTYQLTRTPTESDQTVLANALSTIEKSYPFSPSGVFMIVSYGLPYFNRLSAGVVQSRIPRLASDHSRLVLEEAVPGPTDVSPENPGITKVNFNVPVKIEANDVLITLRSDSMTNISDIFAWLGGSNRLGGRSVASPQFRGLLHQTSQRMMFQQIGLPRKVADANSLPYASEINPDSPMWMGFADQQPDGSAPNGQTVTFAGSSHAHLTTAKPGDYFDNGAIVHLVHDIEDLAQFYNKTTATDGPEYFTERCQYMFRSDPIPSVGNTDQFTNGGGPAFIDNTFQGTGDAENNAEGNTFANSPSATFTAGEHRLGHLATLQRSSRAADGTPLHIRMDGTGFDNLDVPDGSQQPKLHFIIFVPSADFFRTMRINQASLDLQNKFDVQPTDNGLERFLTATRRQNFLTPPRRHRAFPLVELT